MNYSNQNLNPFPFQVNLRDHFRPKDKIWNWFSNTESKEKALSEFKKQIIKDSYRMDATSHPELYQMIEEIKEKLELKIEVTIYQEQMSYQQNVSILFHKEECHIVLSGGILKLLSEKEQKAVFAHELFHYFLFRIDDESFEVTDRIITTIANNEQSEKAYEESAKLFKLYTELYCDRGAYQVMGEYESIISALLKLETGVDKVNVDSYMNQADEIIKDNEKVDSNRSHPEIYFRARALSLWAEKSLEAVPEIEKFIEPKIDFEKLNIFSQKKLQTITKSLISLMLRPKWIQSDAMITMAKSYFPSYFVDLEVEVDQVQKEIADCNEATKKYLGYVLLDFSLADTSQENVPIGHAFELSEYLDLKSQFNLIVKKELKITQRKLTDLQKESMSALQAVNESKEDSIYGE